MEKFLQGLDPQVLIGAGIAVITLLVVVIIVKARNARRRQSSNLDRILGVKKGERLLNVWTAFIEPAPGESRSGVIIDGVRVRGQIIVALTSQPRIALGSQRSPMPAIHIEAGEVQRIELIQGSQGMITGATGTEPADVISVHMNSSDNIRLRIGRSAVAPLRAFSR